MPRILFMSGYFQLPVPPTELFLTNHSLSAHPQSLPSLSRHASAMEHTSLRRIDRLRRATNPYNLIADSSYGTALGDSLNGAGITASWSLAYFLINSRRSLRIRSLHPLSFFVINLAGFNALVYGSYYFLDADTARRTDI